MKIYDCFLFNDENHILEIRLNILNKFVDYFVIIEFGETHQGTKKGQKINFKILNKYKKKIRYFFISKFEKKKNSWQKENFQRNQITKGIFDADIDDIIIVSDVDEIPNLKKVNLNKISNKVYAFSQVHYMYKLNLIKSYNWIGSKLCKKKILKSPQWLRLLKTHKKYSIFRLDKFFSDKHYREFKVIDRGGWHYGWIKTPEQIIKKINSYAHTEHNIPLFNNKNYIKGCIKKKISFLNIDEKLKIEQLKNFPEYLRNNQHKFKKWLF